MKVTVKTLYILIGVVSLPLVFLGWGLLIVLPAWTVAFTIDGHLTTRSNVGKVVAKIIVATLALFTILVAGYSLGSIGNIDTTGVPDLSVLITTIIISLVMAVLVYKNME